MDEHPDNEQRKADPDEERRLVERARPLLERGPAQPPGPEEPSVLLTLEPRRPAVADEETRDEQERADDVEAERDRAVDAGAGGEAEQVRDYGRPRRDRREQDGEAPGRGGEQLHVRTRQPAAARGRSPRPSSASARADNGRRPGAAGRTVEAAVPRHRSDPRGSAGSADGTSSRRAD